MYCGSVGNVANQHRFTALRRDARHPFAHFDAQPLRHFRRITHLKPEAQFLRLLVEQQDGENLVINDFAHQFRHPPQRSVQIERGVDHVSHFQQQRLDLGVHVLCGSGHLFFNDISDSLPCLCIRPWHDADVRQIAITFRVVQSVTYNELIRDAEAHVVCLNGHFSPRGLVEQSSDL